ncbi:MAG: hypothetical protein HY815_27625 [Candidatus Riflebacteria bacterium]|nr:hypothetical protein [Candidatus Riflebacteria bacterium]
MFGTAVRTALALCIALTFVGIANAELLLVNGTLDGEAIPAGYTFELATLDLFANPAAFKIEVVGVSHASTVFADIPADARTQRASEFFALPAVLFAQGSDVYYRSGQWNLKIGTIMGFGNVRWVKLRKGAKIEATLKTARLSLDTAKLSAPDREQLFQRLHRP